MARGKDASAGGKGKDAPAAAKDAAKIAGKKKNLKQLILIGAAALLLIGAGTGAYFYFSGSGSDSPAAGEDGAKTAGGEKDKKDKDSKDKKDKKGESKRPFFVEFEAFTVNLRDPEKFLQIKLTLQVKDVDTAEALKDLMPIVRSAIIPVLASRDAADLGTPEGKEKLCADVVDAARKAVAANGVDEGIQTALITHMIIQ